MKKIEFTTTVINRDGLKQRDASIPHGIRVIMYAVYTSTLFRKLKLAQGRTYKVTIEEIS